MLVKFGQFGQKQHIYDKLLRYGEETCVRCRRTMLQLKNSNTKFNYAINTGSLYCFECFICQNCKLPSKDISDSTGVWISHIVNSVQICKKCYTCRVCKHSCNVNTGCVIYINDIMYHIHYECAVSKINFYHFLIVAKRLNVSKTIVDNNILSCIRQATIDLYVHVLKIYKPYWSKRVLNYQK